MSDVRDLEARFAKVSRGRNVFVRFERTDSLLLKDYQVAFDQQTSAFNVVLRRGGCFEGAYRCIERWIEARAEGLEGIDSVPEGYIDLRSEMQYWMLERTYQQFRRDVESAVTEKAWSLGQAGPGENIAGEVVVEARKRSLVRLLAHLQGIDLQIERGVISPSTVELLKNLGMLATQRNQEPAELDLVFSDGRPNGVSTVPKSSIRSLARLPQLIL